MDDVPGELPELYELATIEQLRAVSDRLRLRIAELLGRRAMTVAQLSAELGLAHAKVHYHVRELEQVGLVRLVETREKSGILEKYYRALAKGFALAPTLLHSVPPDERAAAVAEFFQSIVRGALAAYLRDLDTGQPRKELRTLSSGALFVSDEEALSVLEQVHEVLRPYEEPREGEGVRERTFVQMLYSEGPYEEETTMRADTAMESGSQPHRQPIPGIPPIPPRHPAPPRPPRQPPLPPMPPLVSEPPSRARRRYTIVAGSVAYSRADLEAIAASDKPLNLRVLGHCHIAADVPAELVERAIVRFRYRGTLDASPEVRAVLDRKAREE
jgi:DNA-binding transcriptional ArsR family regulator